MEKNLKIDHYQDAYRSVLVFTGPFTLESLFEAQSQLRADTGETTVIDMTSVPYVDSAGIGALVNAHVSREKSGRRLVLAGVTERVRQTLEVTRVAQVFRFAPTVQDVDAAAS
jgi:anti-sigma B factor antagonist